MEGHSLLLEGFSFLNQSIELMLDYLETNDEENLSEAIEILDMSGEWFFQVIENADKTSKEAEESKKIFCGYKKPLQGKSHFAKSENKFFPSGKK